MKSETKSICRLGGLYGQATRWGVYDANNHIAPTLTAAMGGGGGHTPMIVEDFYKSRPPRVYKDISPTIRSERTGLMRVDVENE